MQTILLDILCPVLRGNAATVMNKACCNVILLGPKRPVNGFPSARTGSDYIRERNRFFLIFLLHLVGFLVSIRIKYCSRRSIGKGGVSVYVLDYSLQHTV